MHSKQLLRAHQSFGVGSCPLQKNWSGQPPTPKNWHFWSGIARTPKKLEWTAVHSNFFGVDNLRTPNETKTCTTCALHILKKSYNHSKNLLCELQFFWKIGVRTPISIDAVGNCSIAKKTFPNVIDIQKKGEQWRKEERNQNNQSADKELHSIKHWIPGCKACSPSVTKLTSFRAFRGWVWD